MRSCCSLLWLVDFSYTGNTIKIGDGYKPQILESDNSVLYYSDLSNIYRYNFEKDKVDWKYENLNLRNFYLINDGKYDGYIVAKVSRGGKDFNDFTGIVFNNKLTEIGNIDDWTNTQDLETKLHKLVTGSEAFTIKVTDPSQNWSNASFTENYFKFYSDPYYSFSDDYLAITPRGSENNNIIPIAVLGNDDGFWGYNAYGGIYQVDVCLSSDDDHNAGIVFNVSNVADGYNNFLGFYAGIDAEGDKVMLRRGEGKNNGDWKNISNKNVGFDIKTGEYYTLKVVKNGSSIQVYLNDVLYITASDDNYKDGIKMFGLRAWNKGAKFKNYTVNPLPY